MLILFVWQRFCELARLRIAHGSNHMAHGPCIHEYRLCRQVGAPLWFTQTLSLKSGEAKIGSCVPLNRDFNYSLRPIN